MENDFLYTGEQYNANTGLYYLRARYMNPSTGTFISMDSYQGSIYDPVSLHKYLYVGANPVMFTYPTGYSRLDETEVSQAGLLMIGASMLFAGTVALNIFSSLRKNMADTVMSLPCTVSVTDWKNVIMGFPAHEFDTKWMITIPMALSSWQLFEAIYATDEDTSHLPGVPADERDEEDKVNGVPAQEWNGTKIIKNNRFKKYNRSGVNTEKGREYSKHALKRAKERGFDSSKIDNIIDNNKRNRRKEINEEGEIRWRYQDTRGNTVITDEYSEIIITVYSYPKSANGGRYISKRR